MLSSCRSVVHMEFVLGRTHGICQKPNKLPCTPPAVHMEFVLGKLLEEILKFFVPMMSNYQWLVKLVVMARERQAVSSNSCAISDFNTCGHAKLFTAAEPLPVARLGQCHT